LKTFVNTREPSWLSVPNEKKYQVERNCRRFRQVEKYVGLAASLFPAGYKLPILIYPGFCSNPEELPKT
jgi:hypothetical protein